jgi:hypothetical protein
MREQTILDADRPPQLQKEVHHTPVQDSDFQALARHAVETGEWYALTDRAVELGLLS